MSYGPVWIDLLGTSISESEIPLLQHPNTGGVILFKKNYASVAQLKELVQAIQSYAGRRLLISVDHEGGRIWRFEAGFTKPLAPGYYGKLYEKDPAAALAQANLAGQMIAYELLDVGVDLNLSPVLDLDHGISQVIGDRAYHRKSNIVVACARAFIEGLKQQGMAAVGKHYPGHGGCTMDSHFTMATDTRSLAEIENYDLRPFVELSAELAGVMPAHVIYSAVDAQAAGFSKFWLQEVLRQRIGFHGAIISDCLSMRGSGYVGNMAQGAELALKAGCDMVIAAQQTRQYLLEVLNNINWQTDALQQQRIQSLAGDFSEHATLQKPNMMLSEIA